MGLLLLGTSTGCSQAQPSPQDKQEETAAAARAQVGQRLRSYFDKSNGKYESLSPEDQKAVDAITGGPSQSKDAFGHMMAPQGGPSTVGGGMAPPPSGDIPK